MSEIEIDDIGLLGMGDHGAVPVEHIGVSLAAYGDGIDKFPAEVVQVDDGRQHTGHLVLVSWAVNGIGHDKNRSPCSATGSYHGKRLLLFSWPF